MYGRRFICDFMECEIQALFLQHKFNEKDVRLKAHTSLALQFVYFPMLLSNEHRLHVLYSFKPIAKFSFIK